MQIKLATWNLHRCVGRDGQMSPQRCAKVLREIDADIIALQEMDSRPGHREDMLAYLAKETGCTAISGATLVRRDTHYGNALLTRVPVSKVRRHDLSVPEREPRGALDIEFVLGQCRLQVIATHLGLRPAERRYQVRRLMRYFDTDNNHLVVLAGDLNEWFLWGRPLRLIHRIFPDTPHRRTWPTSPAVFALDRIWVHPRRALQKLEVHRSATARLASDHLPLVAEIDVHR